MAEIRRRMLLANGLAVDSYMGIITKSDVTGASNAQSITFPTAFKATGLRAWCKYAGVTTTTNFITIGNTRSSNSFYTIISVFTDDLSTTKSNASCFMILPQATNSIYNNTQDFAWP